VTGRFRSGPNPVLGVRGELAGPPRSLLACPHFCRGALYSWGCGADWGSQFFEETSPNPTY